MSSEVRVRCFAKINTLLRVVGRRPDGYHELDTEFLSVSLADDLEIAATDAGFSLRVLDAPDVPVEDNLVMRAARALQAEAGARRVPGAAFVLRKSIPSAAGLGGGSSDAAGALEGLDRLFGLATPRAVLERLALGIGSDVPYFLHGGRQRGRGRGEELAPLPDPPSLPIVLLKPRLPLSTAAVFAEHSRWQAEHPDQAASGTLTSRKTSPTLGEASWWKASGLVVHDDLADAAARLAPQVGEVAEAAERAFPEGIVGMTGSGPTVFVLLGGSEPPDAAERLRDLQPLADGWLTRAVGREEYRASRFA